MIRRLLSVGEAEKKARELLDEDNIEELFELAYGLLKQEDGKVNLNIENSLLLVFEYNHSNIYNHIC